jgi:hypothetical protein
MAVRSARTDGGYRCACSSTGFQLPIPWCNRSTDVHGLVWNLHQPSGNKMECNHEHHRQSVEREPQLFEEAR